MGFSRARPAPAWLCCSLVTKKGMALPPLPRAMPSRNVPPASPASLPDCMPTSGAPSGRTPASRKCFEAAANSLAQRAGTTSKPKSGGPAAAAAEAPLTSSATAAVKSACDDSTTSHRSARLHNLAAFKCRRLGNGRLAYAAASAATPAATTAAPWHNCAGCLTKDTEVTPAVPSAGGHRASAAADTTAVAGATMVAAPGRTAVACPIKSANGAPILHGAAIA
mmetsp:Transcript_143667/g.358108  ORF Transcript_143667/g.358108 Transcript_143667/m.358108 type:complete len:223 (-) Transcript_143667:32-700(-)